MQKEDAAMLAAKIRQPVEEKVLNDLAAKLREQPAVRLRRSKDSKRPQVEADHEDDALGLALLMSVLGSCDVAFVEGILDQLTSLNTYGESVDVNGVNFILSVIKGAKPKDELETILAMQMAVTHLASMIVAKRLHRSENIIEQDSTASAFTKLARASASQFDALSRYRAGGKEKVLQHVSVNDGGQAIVSNITQARGEKVTATDAAPLPPRSAAANVVPIPPIKRNIKRVPLEPGATAAK